MLVSCMPFNIIHELWKQSIFFHFLDFEALQYLLFWVLFSFSIGLIIRGMYIQCHETKNKHLSPLLNDIRPPYYIKSRLPSHAAAT